MYVLARNALMPKHQSKILADRDWIYCNLRALREGWEIIPPDVSGVLPRTLPEASGKEVHATPIHCRRPN